MRAIIADRVTIDRVKREIIASIQLEVAKPCQVHMVVDDDGNVTQVECTDVSCNGVCTLQEEDKGGGKIEYWCTCDA